MLHERASGNLHFIFNAGATRAGAVAPGLGGLTASPLSSVPSTAAPPTSAGSPSVTSGITAENLDGPLTTIGRKLRATVSDIPAFQYVTSGSNLARQGSLLQEVESNLDGCASACNNLQACGAFSHSKLHVSALCPQPGHAEPSTVSSQGLAIHPGGKIWCCRGKLGRVCT
jgi:hypothetical protein